MTKEKNDKYFKLYNKQKWNTQIMWNMQNCSA